jgi:hypothetical protein
MTTSTTIKLTFEQFRDLCHGVQDAEASLGSCLEREAAREAERALRLVSEVHAAELLRANPTLEQLRDRVIDIAMRTHARHGERFVEVEPRPPAVSTTTSARRVRPAHFDPLDQLRARQRPPAARIDPT